LILNRGRQRAPYLRATDRIIAGLCTVFIRRARVLSFAIVLKPSTLLHFHIVMSKRKYRILFSPKRRCRPGPKGADKELIDAVVAMKRRNTSWGCPHIVIRSGSIGRLKAAQSPDRREFHPDGTDKGDDVPQKRLRAFARGLMIFWNNNGRLYDSTKMGWPPRRLLF
jgi:hypothetical protein